jgi:large subunit ribosomal protein L28
MVRLRISMHALRTIEHKGGLDAFLLDAKPTHLSFDLRRLKKRIAKAKAA